jgi:16S rRNA (cytosine967-C5)-methyltransferase
MSNHEKIKDLSKNPRWISVSILSKIEKSDSYLDKLIENEFKSNKLNEQDKRLLNEITNGVVRNRLRIHWVLQKFYNGNLLKINLTLKNVLYVAIYQFLFCDKIPDYAIVHEAVEITKITLSEKLSKLANAVLRNIIRQKGSIDYPDPGENRIKYLSIFYSHPEWMVERWIERFGHDSTEELLILNNKPKDIFIRINTLRTDTAG